MKWKYEEESIVSTVAAFFTVLERCTLPQSVQQTSKNRRKDGKNEKVYKRGTEKGGKKNVEINKRRA